MTSASMMASIRPGKRLSRSSLRSRMKAFDPATRLRTIPASRRMRTWWENVDLVRLRLASCMTQVHQDSP